jgi:hypothetical protein
MKLALSLILLVASTSWAGYEQTYWGMPLQEVQKLYPNGEIQVQEQVQRDVRIRMTSYRVTKSIALQTAIVDFTFGVEDQMFCVMIFFPKPGSKIDLNHGKFTERSQKDSASLFKSLNILLASKYGQPSATDPIKGSFWSLENGDVVMLGNTDGKLSIYYSKPKEYDTTGL